MSDIVREHYDKVLARHYSKLAGDFEVASAKQRQLLESHDVPLRADMTAVDLGCGAGLQSIALARAGCRVTAVDMSATLLAELRERVAALPVDIVEDEIVRFMQQPGPRYQLAVCMGDTLLHLPSRAAVLALFTATAERLAADGVFVVTFRDLTAPLTGLDRFLTLVTAPRLIMRCFLEYHGDHVMVHDLIDEQQEDGSWVEARGAYPKLRLPPDWVVAQLRSAGFAAVELHRSAGVCCVVARVVAIP